MTDASRYIPGSRWVAWRGPHPGMQVVILWLTDLSVYYRPVGRDGVRWNGVKSKSVGHWHISREKFYADYRPFDDYASPGTIHLGSTFRRRRPKMPPECSELRHGLSCSAAQHRLCHECMQYHALCTPWLTGPNGERCPVRDRELQ